MLKNSSLVQSDTTAASPKVTRRAATAKSIIKTDKFIATVLQENEPREACRMKAMHSRRCSN
jgi:hypothetical protein